MNKDISGKFHRVYRDKLGLYGIETLTIEKGKVIDIEVVEASYPTITLSKFGKESFKDAQDRYDQASKTETQV
jgi:hypothetical protein